VTRILTAIIDTAILASVATSCSSAESENAPPRAETSPTSCAAAGVSMTNCGMNKESCCTSPEVPGGSFYRTYVNGGSGPTGLASPATVSSFRLDKYEVTVGRFRRFVKAWSAGYTPPAGSGKHTYLNGGQGLADAASPGTYETGWDASGWNKYVAPTNSNLGCNDNWSGAPTWTAVIGSNDDKPINCVNWYEAYAFCIWDGGFLPSEAEWEYAAAGGSQQREYPWGSANPGTQALYAIFSSWSGDEETDGQCYYPSSGPCNGAESIAPVGTADRGAGAWGQVDLDGNVSEWILDAIFDPSDPFVQPCNDCVDLSLMSSESAPRFSSRGARGGSFNQGVEVSSARDVAEAGERDFIFGFRCARSP
jgi:sulfatase modifying factor 1